MFKHIIQNILMSYKVVIGRSASTKEKPLINISIIEFPEKYLTRLNNIFLNIADACALCDVWANQWDLKNILCLYSVQEIDW